MFERVIGEITGALVRAVESGRVPDLLIRSGIRWIVLQRQRQLRLLDPARSTESFVRAMDAAPVALVPDLANSQHYEVPARFFELALGANRKYSCGLWDTGTTHLDDAERNALQQVVERAEIRDGMQVLDLGCGWGSLSLWLASRFPHAHITGVSNSASQATFIRAEAERRGLINVHIVTADMNTFAPGQTFDRVVSIEMFEHMRNWRELFSRIGSWLNPGGRFFLHTFSHRTTPYPYEDQGEGDWMARHFFTGGMMPSHDLATQFGAGTTGGALQHRAMWWLDGLHYALTAEAWLRNFDHHAPELRTICRSVYGDEAKRWFVRWRIFFLACAGMFAANRGESWGVSHHLFGKDPA